MYRKKRKKREALSQNDRHKARQYARKTNWPGWNKAVEQAVNKNAEEALAGLLEVNPDWNLKTDEHLTAAIRVGYRNDTNWNINLDGDGNPIEKTVVDVLNKYDDIDRQNIVNSIGLRDIRNRQFELISALYPAQEERKAVIHDLLTEHYDDNLEEAKAEFIREATSHIKDRIIWIEDNGFNVETKKIRSALIVGPDTYKDDHAKRLEAVKWYFERYPDMKDSDMMIDLAQAEQYDQLKTLLGNEKFKPPARTLVPLIKKGKTNLVQKVLNQTTPDEIERDLLPDVLSGDINESWSSHNNEYKKKINTALLFAFDAGMNVDPYTDTLYEVAVENNFIGVISWLQEHNYQPPSTVDASRVGNILEYAGFPPEEANTVKAAGML